jgi:hypothetical protein
MQVIHHNNTDEILFTIPAAASTGKSEIIDLGPARPFALQLPAAWTAASITIQASSDGVTFADVYKFGLEYALDAAASRMVVIGTDLVGFQFLIFRSGTSATPVQQAADVNLKLICHSRL